MVAVIDAAFEKQPYFVKTPARYPRFRCERLDLFFKAARTEPVVQQSDLRAPRDGVFHGGKKFFLQNARFYDVKLQKHKPLRLVYVRDERFEKLPAVIEITDILGGVRLGAELRGQIVPRL